MPSLNRALDAGYQDDSALGGIRSQALDIELPFVQGDGQRVVSERRGAVNQLDGRVGNPVDGVVRGMSMQLDLQHRVGLEYYRIRAVACVPAWPVLLIRR